MRLAATLLLVGLLTIQAIITRSIDAQTAGDEIPDDATEATVLEVVDGDTLSVAIDGDPVRVRLIGVDTPETVDPDRPVGCFGPEASDRTKEMLPEG